MLKNDVAEIAVLASMLADATALERAAERLTAEDFAAPHRGLFFALIVETADGEPDPVLVHGQIARLSGWQQEGCQRAEAEVIRTTEFTPANIDGYIDALKECATRRKVKNLAVTLGSECESAPLETLAERLSDATAGLKAGEEITGSANSLFADLSDVASGRRQMVPWPWPELGRQTKALLPGTITLLCGSPGARKSWFNLQALTAWAIGAAKAGMKVAGLMLEDTPEFHLRRSLAQVSGEANVMEDWWLNDVRLAELRAKFSKEMNAVGAAIHRAPDEGIPTLQWAAQWVCARAREGCRVITLDPFTMLDAGGQPWIAEKQFLVQVKRACEDHGASLVLVTHPRKAPGGGSGKPFSPSLDDMAGSAALARFCHCAVWLRSYGETKNAQFGAKAEDYNVSIDILKTRNGRGLGKRLGYQFENKTLRFVERGVLTE